jgi:hypothetical protein
LQLRKRGWGPARIALVRHGRNRLRLPEQKTIRRYEKSRPGELVHLDLKYLYRWKNSQREYAFAGVDDFSREAVAQIRPDRSSDDAAAFLERLGAELPYRIEAVMTDNDLIFTMRYAFNSQRQTCFQQACRSLGIEHWRARPRHHNRTARRNDSFVLWTRNVLRSIGRPQSPIPSLLNYLLMSSFASSRFSKGWRNVFVASGAPLMAIVISFAAFGKSLVFDEIRASAKWLIQ